MFGFYRIAAAVIDTRIADPMANAKSVIDAIDTSHAKKAAVTLLPELTLVSYTAADLLTQAALLEKQDEALDFILKNMPPSHVVIVGYALRWRDRLYNTALVLQNGKILGCVPKSYLPNKREFYEKRWFVSGRAIREEHCVILDQTVPFGVDLLFSDGGDVTIGVELCEDLWAVTPPSLAMAEAGATLLCNLSASNELIGKAAYRRELVRTQSARCIAAYAYASSGLGESTTDTLFGGDAMIADYGAMVAQGERFCRKSLVVADVDFERLRRLRVQESAFCDAPVHLGTFRTVALASLTAPLSVTPRVDPYPFVPASYEDRKARCEEIVHIQAHALLSRMQRAGIDKAVIGVSGGLDSTLALLSTYEAFRIAGKNARDIVAVTMPGFGTTTRTKSNALKLCEVLGVTYETIDISQMAREQLRALGHDENKCDVTYENVQARLRTALLMNKANQIGALVIGTGDLSEIALGWSTYNGDHMSMYGLNSGIPKTLVRYIIEYFAQTDAELAPILRDILDTPVSPELLPHDNDTIVQETESIVGPYELHDFFLYHFVKYGFTPEKIAFLASAAFKERYDDATIRRWLGFFIRRFFTQQFKRSAMPDGPKVGTIALSPRADWRMPSDATMQAWISTLNQ